MFWGLEPVNSIRTAFGIWYLIIGISEEWLSDTLRIWCLGSWLDDEISPHLFD